jgi:hypothetical protein
MSSAYVRIDLDDLDTDDLIDELENRCLDNDESERLLTIVKDNESDKMKLFIKVMDKYSLMELQEMFAERFDALPSKYQIPLPF